MSNFRTDRNNNPTAFTTAMAEQAGLAKGADYGDGDSFLVSGSMFLTARLLGDPIALTIRVIDKLGFYTSAGGQRWTYIAIPYALWKQLTPAQRVLVIGFMYGREGGTDLKHLFA